MTSNLFGLILIVVVGIYDFVNELRKYEQGADWRNPLVGDNWLVKKQPFKKN